MRNTLTCCAWSLVAMMLVGCLGTQTVQKVPVPDATPQPTGPSASVTGRDGLKFTLQVPNPTLHAGETFTCLLTAVNVSAFPITVRPRPGSPVRIHVWRRDGAGWGTVRSYPPATVPTETPWTAQAGEVRQMEMTLTVEPDWPVGNTAMLVAELNGRADLAPRVMVDISSESP